jgi:hypothetical protein
MFEESRIVRMQEQYERLLESIVEEPEARLSMLEILTDAEKKEQESEEKSNARMLKTVKRVAVSVARKS